MGILRLLLREYARLRLPGGAATIDYGAPAGSGGDGSSTNVVAQWVCNESSGNLVDGVNSITLVPLNSPTYNNAAIGDFAGLSPGVGIDESGDRGFRKTTATTALDIPNGTDFVVEGWYSSTSGRNGCPFLDMSRPSDDHGIALKINAISKTISTRFEDDSDNLVTGLFSAADVVDGNIHKLRLAVDHSTQQEMFFDDISVGTTAFGVTITNQLTCSQITLGHRNSVNFTFLTGFVYEARITIGNFTNNSGGPVSP